MRESAFQRQLIKKIEKLFPGVVILKNNPDHIQGIPDLTILWRQFWATLEVKESENASIQPNQDYWIKRLGEYSYSAFVYPENEKEVLDALQHTFGLAGQTRIS
jgi:hypothetical protein